MDLRRLRAGEWILGAGGVAVLVSLFLPWYGESAAGELSGWDSLRTLDVVMTVCALAAFAVVVLTALAPTPSPSIAAQALFTLPAFGGLVMVAVRVLSPPEGFAERMAGQWLGLAAMVALLAGALVAMRDERKSAPGRPTDPTGVPVSAPAEVEQRPAPPRGSSS